MLMFVANYQALIVEGVVVDKLFSRTYESDGRRYTRSTNYHSLQATRAEAIDALHVHVQRKLQEAQERVKQLEADLLKLPPKVNNMSIWILQESWTIIGVWHSKPSLTQLTDEIVKYKDCSAESAEREATALLEVNAEAQLQLQEHPVNERLG